MTAKKSVSPRLLAKAATGILGFDEISRGGLPRNRTSLVMGGPGTGKTVFALQTLVNAAQERKQPGIFVAFEEGPDEIRANAATFGWGLPALAQSAVFFLDARLTSSASKLPAGHAVSGRARPDLSAPAARRDAARQGLIRVRRRAALIV